MSIKNNFLYLFSLVFVFISCDTIMEEDISNNTVIPIYPNQDAEILGETVNFQWTALDGADDYRLQIYGKNTGIMLDSLVSSTPFLYNLTPGQYSWRVRGENFAYHTPYNFPIEFSVEASDDLTTQHIILDSPSDGFYTNQTNITYSWQGLTAATTYDFELHKNLNGSAIVHQSNVTETSYTVPENSYDEDAEYSWKVKGVNEASETQFSERTIFLDTETPPVPTLESPTDTSISNQSMINFAWNIGTDTGNIQSERSSIIQVATDLEFTDIIEQQNLSIENADISFPSSGTFYWRVKAVDIAGNEGDYSDIWSFTIN